MFDSVVECFGFARVCLAENQNLARSSLGSKRLARDLKGSIFRAVVDHNHAQVGIVRIESRADGTLNDLFFVVGGNQNRNFGLVRSDFGGLAENLFVQAVVNRCRADKNEAAGHQHVPNQENPGNQDNSGVEEPETQTIQPGCPQLAARQRRHHVRLLHPE